MKTTICEMKNTLDIINSNLITAEEKINEYKYIAKEAIQRKQGEKRF